MDRSSNVTVHESAYPETVRKRIVTGLKRGELDPSLLYAGLRQTLRWIALHHGHSPSKTDPACSALYAEAFEAVTDLCKGNVAHVVSLACGDGTKDTTCLQGVRGSGRAVLYTPVDVSLEMVLTAEQTARNALSGLQANPLLCDLPNCSVLPAYLKGFDPSGAERIILFLGTIHNFWPPEILRSLLYPLRSQDHLLLSANLAPAEGYDVALSAIKKQYDNDLTRNWLSGAVEELNLSSADGTLEFSIQSAESMPPLKRIQCDFVFSQLRRIDFFGESIEFAPGQKLRVFYSYRFQAPQIREFLTRARLNIVRDWITPSGEEGLFLCRRAN